jgi:hypothetical protein
LLDLRPGTYSITYTLPGFTTFKRDGVILPTAFTATIDVELKVGELAETITVTGESPVVDVTTAVHTAVLTAKRSTRFPPAAASRAWVSWLSVSASTCLTRAARARCSRPT